MGVQLLSLAGSALVLAAYAALQLRGLKPTDWRYLLANGAGTVLLLAAGVELANWGFIALNTTWLLITAYPVLKRRA
jgi:hypothetical protein